MNSQVRHKNLKPRTNTVKKDHGPFKDPFSARLTELTIIDLARSKDVQKIRLAYQFFKECDSFDMKLRIGFAIAHNKKLPLDIMSEIVEQHKFLVPVLVTNPSIPDNIIETILKSGNTVAAAGLLRNPKFTPGRFAKFVRYYKDFSEKDSSVRYFVIKYARKHNVPTIELMFSFLCKGKG